MSDSARQNVLASSPFDDPDADIILQSSNNVKFHVYSVILKLASPIFRDMFSIPQPPTQASKPIVEMEEDSTTLDTMLRLCYPGPDPRVTELVQLTSILRVAEKYDLDGVVEKMGHDYLKMECIEDSPVEAFAMACRYRWKEVAISAAKASLLYTTDDLLQLEAEALKSITGMDYHRLFQYHHACRQACIKLTKQVEWMFKYGYTSIDSYSFERHANSATPKAKKCSDVKQLGYRSFPSWWCKYMEGIGMKFMLQGPATVHLTEQTLQDAVSSISGCKLCKDMENFGDMYKFLERFRIEIDTAIRHVKLKLPF